MNDEWKPSASPPQARTERNPMYSTGNGRQSPRPGKPPAATLRPTPAPIRGLTEQAWLPALLLRCDEYYSTYSTTSLMQCWYVESSLPYPWGHDIGER